MKKIYMYAHGGSGNHGCEAIVRSTVKILKELGYEAPVLISSNPEEDMKYGIDNICCLIKDRQPYSKWSLDFILAYLRLKLCKDHVPMDKLEYKNALKQMKRGDIVLSIGGDNYCYEDVRKYIMLHDLMLERGAKTVLWGCSVEPELINDPEIAEDLSRYRLIIARESISYQALKKVNDNTVLASDPAFFLDSVETKLSGRMEQRDYVGINMSPMVMKKERIKGIVIKNYSMLIQSILKQTDMSILLIPHVVWEENDDREALETLYHLYKGSQRVIMVPDASCEEIKGIISKCRFFVGARTHAAIAAYSAEVPAIVIGYSVKARGMGADLLGEEDFVIPVENLKTEEELLNTFWILVEKEEEVGKKLMDYKSNRDREKEKIKNAMMRLQA